MNTHKLKELEDKLKSLEKKIEEARMLDEKINFFQKFLDDFTREHNKTKCRFCGMTDGIHKGGCPSIIGLV